MNDLKHINKSNAPPKLRLLLKLRDGPRGRDPALRAPVTLYSKSSVAPCLKTGKLCGFSVDSVVNRRINHKELREDTEDTEIYALIPTKTFRTNCTENGRLQEENFGRIENSGVLECMRVILSLLVLIGASGAKGR